MEGDYVPIEAFLVGDDLVLRAPDLEQLRVNQRFLVDAPAVTVRRTSAQSIPFDQDTAVSWQRATRQGPGGEGMWNPASPSDVTIVREGNHLIAWNVEFNDLGADPADEETTDREVRIERNGAVLTRVCVPAARSGTGLSGALITNVAEGDDIRMIVRHLSAGGAIQTRFENRLRLSVRWVALISPPEIGD